MVGRYCLARIIDAGTSEAKHIGALPPGLEYALRAPQRRPARSVLYGQAQLPGWRAMLWAMIPATTSASVCCGGAIGTRRSASR